MNSLFQSVEKEAVKSWGSQCQDNIYDCLSSPDGETGQVSIRIIFVIVC